MNPAPPPHGPPRVTRQYVTVPLARRESIGSNYHVLTFDVPDGLDARPGQFLMLRGADWSQDPLLPRPMSCLNGGSEPSVLIRVAGEGTARMARATPGDRFRLLGPLGNGWRNPRPGRQLVLVGGGVGIAPLLFLARSLADRRDETTALYGGRTSRDLPLDDELARVARVVLSTEDGSRGIRGRVTDALERELEARRDVDVFTCGPEPMMEAVAAICAAHDVPCEVSLETPMACGFGVCLGCAVPRLGGGYLYACSEGPCVDAGQVDWSRPARASGAAVASRNRLP
jgi:dihydroorotate dehydrogenase electron transfer subunit